MFQGMKMHSYIHLKKKMKKITLHKYSIKSTTTHLDVSKRQLACSLFFHTVCAKEYIYWFQEDCIYNINHITNRKGDFLSDHCNVFEPIISDINNTTKYISFPRTGKLAIKPQL